ncbi:LacI family DNA-binding transcriptional regulator [Microbacterium sp. NIBRBAC000506063]|uniref:LacI family DNA-binding transcriptional regulator n=1 Tax=Microbacterium sp. NIBRBAC000506063 TaxID=2734618 RepID=UPI001CB6F88C|nr:LacI family DNA-binding transcriptional regulator [Microbacterium sp. NIBRBAC000506063]
MSLATMSKVLNGRSDVSPTTRARLEALLNEHGYKRRNAARAASSSNSSSTSWRAAGRWRSSRASKRSPTPPVSPSS